MMSRPGRHELYTNLFVRGWPHVPQLNPVCDLKALTSLNTMRMLLNLPLRLIRIRNRICTLNWLGRTGPAVDNLVFGLFCKTAPV